MQEPQVGSIYFNISDTAPAGTTEPTTISYQRVSEELGINYPEMPQITRLHSGRFLSVLLTLEMLQDGKVM